MRRREAIAEFLKEIRSPKPGIRFAAVACLGGLRAIEAVDILAAVVCDNSEDALMRFRAVAALGEIGPPAHNAVKTIIANYDNDYRDIICDALSKIGTNAALEFVKKRRPKAVKRKSRRTRRCT